MFRKILIANRGEIACRVMATAKHMGIGTVAVYSDADAGAKHVRMADEAVRIGPPSVSESYLLGARIIEAARLTGAEAIHPGYGFLSENPDFVEAVEDAGLVFIGPPAKAIRAMGLKDAAKALMVDAGVPVVPGYHGENQNPDFLAGEAEKIGYPVLIKARAGGGGKGMRLVERPEDFRAAFDGARREGQASFGDGACLIEKYVSSPRHIEIQVFGDAHGNVIHLFERDCSLQRRHQKVIEEAPAPHMPENVRAAMGRAAVDAARAIGYRGAGTVEFIVDGSGPLREDGFWFMEMNTRLQVEHPVSEAITGLDFVELQLRVAAGEALPVRQQDLKIDGWAFEARIYAEDVGKGFLPATGILSHLEMPQGVEFSRGDLRVDSGVMEGDIVSPWYDPMIAKLIVHGPDRMTALARLEAALGRCRLAGVTTNVSFLASLSRHADFVRGDVDTHLIARDIDTLTGPDSIPPIALGVAAIEALNLLRADQTGDPWHRLTNWRQFGTAAQNVRLIVDGASHSCRVLMVQPQAFSVSCDGVETLMTVHRERGTQLRVTAEGRQIDVHVFREAGNLWVFSEGRSHVLQVHDPLDGSDVEGASGDDVFSPMPGMIKHVSGRAGDRVEQGQALVILEAMKMEHTLTAPRDGELAEIPVEVGRQVSDGALLFRLVPLDEAQEF